MLDQNTDRMWYVIGAVLVGAAIILIANGTMPDMFASVTETFKGSSESALSVIHEITDPKLVIDGNHGRWENWMGNSENGINKAKTTTRKEDSGEWIIRVDNMNISTEDRIAAMESKGVRPATLEPGEKYRLSFDVRGDVDVLDYTYILTGSRNRQNQQFNMSYITGINESSFTHVSHEFTYGSSYERSSDVRILIGSRPDSARWLEFKNAKVERVEEES